MKFKKLLSAGIAAVITVCSIEAVSIFSAAEEAEETDISIAIAFPDAVFSNYVSHTFDLNGDGKLSSSECESVTSINVAGTASFVGGIESLAGIEHFTKLNTLNCSYNKLTSLDVSSLSRLETLDCSHNMLASLSYPNLSTLDCSYNQLESISINHYLVTLKCNNNKIRNLDLVPSGWSSNNYLVTLDCSNNRLGCLNTRNCNKLNKLNLDNNCYELGSNVVELRGDSTLLPVGFVMKYTDDWENAYVYNRSYYGYTDNEYYTISDITRKIITYTYEISYGSKVKFSMYVDNDGLPGTPPWSGSGGSTITYGRYRGRYLGKRKGS